ncbi:MAG: hypothetical protein JNM82_11845, partial [Rhodocyclaceae bacterium]|nr:hypothetical protein [Rhodocyclaceae bacterium]
MTGSPAGIPPRRRPGVGTAAARAAGTAGRALALLLLCSAAGGSSAAADAEATKGELKALRGRIQSLERDLSRSEQSRARNLDRLRETEAAVAAANRRLRELAGERAAVEAEMRAADEQAGRLAARIAGPE